MPQPSSPQSSSSSPLGSLHLSAESGELVGVGEVDGRGGSLLLLARSRAPAVGGAGIVGSALATGAASSALATVAVAIAVTAAGATSSALARGGRGGGKGRGNLQNNLLLGLLGLDSLDLGGGDKVLLLALEDSLVGVLGVVNALIGLARLDGAEIGSLLAQLLVVLLQSLGLGLSLGGGNALSLGSGALSVSGSLFSVDSGILRSVSLLVSLGDGLGGSLVVELLLVVAPALFDSLGRVSLASVGVSVASWGAGGSAASGLSLVVDRAGAVGVAASVAVAEGGLIALVLGSLGGARGIVAAGVGIRLLGRGILLDNVADGAGGGGSRGSGLGGADRVVLV